MTDVKDEGERKAAKGAMKEAIGMIVGDREAESAGAEDKAAGAREASARRKAKAATGKDE